MKKQIDKSDVASLLKDGMSIMVGGFMTVGTPKTIIDAIVASDVSNLTLYCNDAGLSNEGIGKIIESKKVKCLYASHIGLNPNAQTLMNNGEIEIKLIPQGTLIEQIRAGGSGLGGILTPTGIGTLVEEGKQIIEVDGKKFILEKPLTADLSIVKANIVDKYGNCKLLGTTINFNPVIALAGKTVIVEYSEMVDNLNPNDITIPHVVVDYLIEEIN